MSSEYCGPEFPSIGALEMKIFNFEISKHYNFEISKNGLSKFHLWVLGVLGGVLAHSLIFWNSPTVVLFSVPSGTGSVYLLHSLASYMIISKLIVFRSGRSATPSSIMRLFLVVGIVMLLYILSCIMWFSLVPTVCLFFLVCWTDGRFWFWTDNDFFLFFTALASSFNLC